MGVVYEAVRDDETFQKRVAIKVAGGAAWSPEFLRRFQAERQILARLEHPHIARLLDGGATAEGVPYFAMDFVEGVAIHHYARDRRLSVRERIALFLQVCDAVEYAHQNLVVHCDLKPGNILVASESVRLLDFGIARLVETTDGARTVSGSSPLTPDYCSPEQLRGQPVTTRTDVYALGLVLYELLTGERGQVADTTSALTLERSVCETAIDAPSVRVRPHDRALARHLTGDLDTIVLTATQKDPARRYASVAALADDLRRHLDGRPILARHDSAWYRGSRFVRRHWLPLGAAVLVGVTLAAGIIAATYQARRAERRFEQVRSIANALMVDVHEAIRDLPSSTEAQEVVVRTALQYLDGLAPEAQGDTALQLEVVRGYLKVAELSYAMSKPSLGRPEDARQSYGKAAALLSSLDEDNASDVAVTTARVAYQVQIGEFYFDTGKVTESLASNESALATAEAGVVRHPDSLEMLEALAEALDNVVSSFAAHPRVRPLADRYVEVAEQLSRLRPSDADSAARLGVAYSQAANQASQSGDEDRARDLYRKSIEQQSRAVSLEPGNATARRNLMIAWSNVGDLELGPLGTGSYVGSGGPQIDIGPARRAAAREAFAKALEQAQWLFDRDPANDTVRYDYAICLIRQAPSWPPGHPRPIADLERSLAILEELEPRNPARTWAYLVELQGSLAERLRQAGQMDRAIRAWNAIDGLLQKALAADPDAYYPRRIVIPMFENWAQALAAGGDRAGARRLAARLVTLGDEVGAREAQYARAAGWPPRVRGWLADFYTQLGDREAAARARAESLELWTRVAARSDLPDDLVQEARQQIGDRR
jgi:non-specific serine/threonine protein kinase/serine/threonine-protein kinase